MQLEKARCAIGAVDLPAGTLEDLDDVRAVDLLQSWHAVNGRTDRNSDLSPLAGLTGRVAIIRLFEWGRQALSSDLQVGARRQYDCALDYVFQFAYVAWPRVGDETFHRCFRNA